VPEPKALLKPRANSRLDQHRRQRQPGRKAPLCPIPAKLKMSVELDKLVAARNLGHRQRLEAQNNNRRRKQLKRSRREGRHCMGSG
jgi:hypothetical protein